MRDAHLHYHTFFQGWEAGESKDRERRKLQGHVQLFSQRNGMFVSLIWQHSNRLEIVVFQIIPGYKV